MVGPFGDDFPNPNHGSSEGEQWGRYNLPIYMYIYIYIIPLLFQLLTIKLYIFNYINYNYITIEQHPSSFLGLRTVLRGPRPRQPQGPAREMPAKGMRMNKCSENGDYM